MIFIRKNFFAPSEKFVIISLIIALQNFVFVLAKNTTNNCGGNFSGYQYTISSPNYPNNYSERQDCVYILHGNHLAKCDQIFHLQFLDFSLKTSNNCYEDYLKIGDRSFYCGSVFGIRSFIGKNNSLEIRFHSGTTKGGKGFKILVTTLPCAIKQNDDNYANFTEKTSTKESNSIIAKNPNTAKIGSRNDLEIGNLFDSEDLYPVYKPEVDYAIDNNKKLQFDKADEPPLRIKIFENSENKFNPDVPKNPAKTFELPVRQNSLFRDPTKLEIVTPTSINPKGSKISAYLFVPPSNFEDSNENTDFRRFPSTNVSKELKNDVDQFVTQPPTDFQLPNHWRTTFHESPKTFPHHERSNNKLIIPARSYGIPEVPYYPPTTINDPEIKTGEVLENSSDTENCNGNKPNLVPDLEVTANFRAKNPALINFAGTGSSTGTRSNCYPAVTYGLPGSTYPTNIPNKIFDKTPNFNYAPGSSYYPENDVITGSGRPNGWIPSVIFPTNNVGNGYPNFIPPPGIATGNGRYSECCNTVCSSQRCLLSSPGFPAILYSGNAYDCIYTIRPYSPKICQMRFNFKFLNHGAEDRFCSAGYVEIDGNRICGCKKGLSIVSPVYSAFPKTIGVKYTGYPRTKFNGFVIEVIQEPCTNSYPFGSRRKKDVGNSTSGMPSSNLERPSFTANSTLNRTKRNLGYSYPKPNLGFVEVPGVSQSWNTGTGIQTGIHQILNDGVSANLFSPILSCQALSFFDWTLAAKEVYLRGARCIKNGIAGDTSPGWNPGYPGNWIPGTSPGYPGNGGIPTYPGNGGSGSWNPVFPGGGSGNWNPGYPGTGGSGTFNPGYPGFGGSGTINPGYPGIGGSGTINPGYPGTGGSGTINPGYPGIGGSGTINPGYPGIGGSGTINPGYPGIGGSGTINPGYPGIGGSGTINPGYPGTGGSGTINPGYPGTGGSGTINPGYPGIGGSGTINPGHPGTGGSGTINPGYPGSGSWNFPVVQCDDVNVAEGIISSPQYPLNYPSNVKKCFRFYKAPSSCKLELTILDFDLENSVGCTKDYVAFSGQNRRYCGRSLAGSKTVLDISRCNYLDVYFVSDGFGSGRGFSAGFSQIKCPN